MLMLGGAKRVAMARRFKESAARLGYDLHVYSYELSEDVAISLEADEVIVGLRWSDPAVDADLRRVVAEKDIRLVVPFVDGAIPVASRLFYKKRGHRTSEPFAPVMDSERCSWLNDKVKSAEWFESERLPIPDTYCREGRPLRFPAIAKPRYGAASKGLCRMNNAEEYETWLSDGHNPDDYLIQQYIDKAEEYTVDCYIDGDGIIRAVSPRRRIEVAGGEVVVTETVAKGVMLDQMVDLAEVIIQRLQLVGAVTIQLLRNAYGALALMEINPRLGGGAVASINADVDLPGMIIAETGGYVMERQWPTPGVKTTRYLDDIAFKDGKRYKK